MRRTVLVFGQLAGVLASCTLAYLAATFLVLDFFDLLLAATTEVELVGFESRYSFPSLLPRVITHLPGNSTTFLHILDQASFLLMAATLLLGVWLVLPRTRGWLRLFLVHGSLWAGALLLLYGGVYAVWGRGPMNGLVQALWPDLLTSDRLRIALGFTPAVFGGAALSLLLRSVLGGSGTRLARLGSLLHRIALPATVVTAVVLIERFSCVSLVRWRFPVVFLVGVAGLALLAGLPAVLRPLRTQAALPLSPRGSAVVVLLLGLVLSGVAGSSRLIRFLEHRTFASYRSHYWELQLDETARASISPARAGAAADQRLRELANRLTLTPPNPGLRAYYYSSVDRKSSLTESDEPYTLDPEGSAVHHLVASDGRITDPRGDALLLMRKAWGKPGSEGIARALARYAVGEFHSHPLAGYAARIAREEEPYRLREVFLESGDYLSPLVRDALGGAWVELVVEQRGQAVLPALYRTALANSQEEEFARTLDSSWEELEQQWRNYLLAHLAPAPSPLPLREKQEGLKQSPRSSRRSRSLQRFHRGISFSHEVGGTWGYGSDTATKQLERILSLGANAVAIVPYAFTRAPGEQKIFFGTDETDTRVVRTLEAARQLGLRVTLKPQLWGPTFTGDIAFESQAEFDRWFGPYRRWLLHFARLAELHQVDLLVIGTELGGVTRHETEWRDLIRDLRRIFRGPLTYAAHWGRDFEELPFWDALDLLGVNMYYPLAEPNEIPRSDSAQLQELVEKFGALARKHGKPVLFTEVGYPSIVTAASSPWEERRAGLDLEQQRQCYETVFNAFYRQPWLAGLYWWKWPSHGLGNRYDSSYSPVGKPAEEVLRLWYQEAPRR